MDWFGFPEEVSEDTDPVKLYKQVNPLWELSGIPESVLNQPVAWKDGEDSDHVKLYKQVNPLWDLSGVPDEVRSQRGTVQSLHEGLPAWMTSEDGGSFEDIMDWLGDDLEANQNE